MCGYDRCPRALDFHHRDPQEKDFEIAKARDYSLKKDGEKLKRELDKCDLLCSNCHRELHHKFELEGNPKAKVHYKNCEHCGKQYKPSNNKKFCSKECRFAKCLAGEEIRKGHRPTKEQLAELVEIKTLQEIADLYHVKWYTVKKWCEKYQIARPDWRTVKPKNWTDLGEKLDG